MNRIRLFLVRHGQTDYNLKHLLQGSGINSSLNQTGQNEAEKLKNTEKLLMKTDMIYASPLERAFVFIHEKRFIPSFIIGRSETNSRLFLVWVTNSRGESFSENPPP